MQFSPRHRKNFTVVKMCFFLIIINKKLAVFCSYLIGFVEGGDPLVWRGYMYAGLLLGITLLRAIVNQQPFYGKLVIGQRIRSAMTAAIYRKVRP